MAASTSRGAFPYPTGGDNWKQFRLAMQALADRVAGQAALYVESTAAARPAPGAVGRFHRATDTGVLTYDTGSAWQDISTKTVPLSKTFTVTGEVKVPVGEDFVVPSFFARVPAGVTVRLAGARFRIRAGTSVTVELRRNGTAVAGFGATVTTTPAEVDPADVTLADDDELALVVTAVAGAPKNLTYDVFLDVVV